MALDNSLLSLVSTFTASIQSATEVAPKAGSVPTEGGISLLDVKNDLLLSYLQNLVFLILLKLRSQSQRNKRGTEVQDVDYQVVQKLVELRIYLEKGVRPLESRLKYQIDNLIRAADDASRKSTKISEIGSKSLPNKTSHLNDSDLSEDESVASDETEEETNEMSYKPNRAALVSTQSRDNKATESSRDGIYRPPRITPMAMPTTQGREEKEARRAGKSATLDEFVATELSTAPLAEPSIGSTIVSGGRRMKSDRERKEDAERRDYEESNFVRLPTASKKDRAKDRNRARNGGWGGEEWRGLGAGLDRIERLTQKKGGSLGSLEKSRKRPIQDGPRGTGSTAGEAFEKRRKVVSRHRK